MMSSESDAAVESTARWADVMSTLIIWDDSSTPVNKVKKTRRWAAPLPPLQQVQADHTELMGAQRGMTAVEPDRAGDARYARDGVEGGH